MDRGAWWAIVHGFARELDMTEPLTLSYFHFQPVLDTDPSSIKKKKTTTNFVTKWGLF